MSSGINCEDPLLELLREVQLEEFYDTIRGLSVTRIEHFDKVLVPDLTDPKVNMSAPAARRLIAAAKNKIKERKRKNFLNSFLPKTSSNTISKQSHQNNNRRNSLTYMTPSNSLTCLIASKDIKQLNKLGDGSFGVSLQNISFDFIDNI